MNPARFGWYVACTAYYRWCTPNWRDPRPVVDVWLFRLMAFLLALGECAFIADWNARQAGWPTVHHWANAVLSAAADTYCLAVGLEWWQQRRREKGAR